MNTEEILGNIFRKKEESAVLKWDYSSITVTVNTYSLLLEQVSYCERIDKIFQRWYEKEDARSSYVPDSRNFVKWLKGRLPKANFGKQVGTCWTGGSDSYLDEDFATVDFEADGTNYVILGVCDAYRCRNEHVFTMDGEYINGLGTAILSCTSKEEAHWWGGLGTSWMAFENENFPMKLQYLHKLPVLKLEEKKLKDGFKVMDGLSGVALSDPASYLSCGQAISIDARGWAEGILVVEEDGRIRCPVCGETMTAQMEVY